MSEEFIKFFDEQKITEVSDNHISSNILNTFNSKQNETSEEKELLEKLKKELEKKQAILDQARKLIEKDRIEMERLLNLKNDFISAVSHELRTPLTSIKESISLIQDGSAGPLSETQKKFLDIAQNNIDRLSRLINNLLDFSKIESGKLKLARKVTRPEELVNEAVKTFSLEIKKKNISLITNFEENLPIVYIDRDRIVQVILNLISNALKFTPAGGTITIEVKLITDFPGYSEVAINFEEGQKFLYFSVTDTGPGIKKEELSRLFQKFEQLDSGIARRVEGIGLGLVVSKGFVESHGGKIWVESEYKKGSKFQFVIPVVAPPKILVVDDEKDIVNAIENFLKEKQFQILKAFDGIEALEVIKNNLPDLIILDIKMPRMDGYQVIKNLKSDEKTQGIPILILSGYTIDTALLKSYGLSLVHSIAKPFDFVELMLEIDILLREKG